MVLEALLTVGAIAAYLGIGVAYSAHETKKGNLAPGDGPLVSVIWLPFVILYVVFRPFFWIYDGVRYGKWPTLPKMSRTERKVLAYSQSPTLILAQVVGSKMIAYPEGLKYDKWTSEDGQLKVDFFYACDMFNYVEVRSNNSIVKRDEFCDKGKKILDQAYEKTSKIAREMMAEKKESDRQLLDQAREKTSKIAREMMAAKKESDRQLKALAVVESLLLQPEKD